MALVPNLYQARFPKIVPVHFTRPHSRKQQDAAVLTSMPYKEDSEEKNKASKNQEEAKKEGHKNQKIVKVKRRLVEEEEEEDEDDKDEDDYKEGSKSSGGIHSVGYENFEDFDRTTIKLNEFVLVCLKDQKEKDLYFVGKIINEKEDESNEFEVSFMRRSVKKVNSFVNPNVPDVAWVSDEQIKLKLPTPDVHGQTKRQMSYIIFVVN